MCWKSADLLDVLYYLIYRKSVFEALNWGIPFRLRFSNNPQMRTNKGSYINWLEGRLYRTKAPESVFLGCPYHQDSLVRSWNNPLSDALLGFPSTMFCISFFRKRFNEFDLCLVVVYVCFCTDSGRKSLSYANFCKAERPPEITIDKPLMLPLNHKRNWFFSKHYFCLKQITFYWNKCFEFQRLILHSIKFC